MAFKTFRQGRYEYLREHGFLPFEARTLSARMPNKKKLLPFIKAMVDDRMLLVKQSNKENWSQKKFRATIYQLYNVRGWKMARGSTDASINRNSAWAMSHYFEELYRAQHNDYKSPAPKRKDHIEDVRKFAKQNEVTWA